MFLANKQGDTVAFLTNTTTTLKRTNLDLENRNQEKNRQKEMKMMKRGKDEGK